MSDKTNSVDEIFPIILHDGESSSAFSLPPDGSSVLNIDSSAESGSSPPLQSVHSKKSALSIESELFLD